MTKKKVVVTGGAGFIGSHVVDSCIAKGWDVHIIDNFDGGKKDERINPEASFHKVDIRDYDNLAPIIKGSTYVFHLAALPKIQDSVERPKEAHDVNVSGTVNVLTAANEGGVEKVIFSSSAAVYGDNDRVPVSESVSVDPKNPYGLHKVICEQYCKLWSEQFGLNTVCLRYFNAYGSRLDPEGAYALAVGKFLKQRKDGDPITITGDGSQTRDFVHVSDIVQANILAAESDGVGSGEVLNIGSGRETTINTVADLIGGEVSYISPRNELHRSAADNGLAKKYLIWEPQVDFVDGINELKKEWGIS